MKFSFIHAEKAFHGVRSLCRNLGVSPAGYYAWVGRDRSQREREDEVLSTHIRAIHAASKDVYGAPRIHAELHRQGFSPSLKRVQRLMREAGVRGVTPRPWRSTTDSNHDMAVAPNRLERDFTAAAPDRVWVADITYIWTWEGWLYLAAIVDVYSRRVVGWAAASHMRAELVVEALQMALRRRNPPAGLIHHSDRGTQYASDLFQRALLARGILCSMSRAGDCYDNAVIESFFGSLKNELINRRGWPTRQDATAALAQYLDVFYDSQRLHSTLGYRTPAEVERQYAATADAA